MNLILQTDRQTEINQHWPEQNLTLPASVEIAIISMLLSISIIECEHSWYTIVSYPICQSLCLSVSQSVSLPVGPESVLWQHGWLDPDTIWGGEWGRSRDGCIRWVHVPQGEGKFFVSIGLNGVFFNRNIFNSCVKSWQFLYGQYIIEKVSLLAFQRNSQVWDRSWGLREVCKCNSHFTQKLCQAANYYTTLMSHGDDRAACKCAVTSVPDISVLGHFRHWAWLVCSLYRERRRRADPKWLWEDLLF